MRLRLGPVALRHRLSHNDLALPDSEQMLAARQNEDIAVHGRMRLDSVDFHAPRRALQGGEGAAAAAIGELDRIGGGGGGSQLAIEVEEAERRGIRRGLQRVSSGGNPDCIAVRNGPKMAIQHRRAAPLDTRAARA